MGKRLIALMTTPNHPASASGSKITRWPCSNAPLSASLLIVASITEDPTSTPRKGKKRLVADPFTTNEFCSPRQSTRTAQRLTPPKVRQLQRRKVLFD